MAYVVWGLFPLFFKQVAQVPALEVVAHRAAWSAAVMALVLLATRRGAAVVRTLRSPRALATYGASAALLATNWLFYVWAVNHDRVVDASLGYFINPLVNVALGVVVLKERPRRAQWWAVAIAAAGVAWLAFASDHMPWVALVLAGSFGLYGLLRKTQALGPIDGLAVEAALQAPFAVVGLVLLAATGGGHFGRDLAPSVWLALAGPLTVLPLLLFAYGARRVTMATLGLLQYLGPTIGLLLGVLLYGEPFDLRRAIGFAFIWTALLVYSVDAWRALRRTKAAR